MASEGLASTDLLRFHKDLLFFGFFFYHAGHGGGGGGGCNKETGERLQAVCEQACVNLLMEERNITAPSVPTGGHVTPSLQGPPGALAGGGGSSWWMVEL